jgi:hypothetical protein
MDRQPRNRRFQGIDYRIGGRSRSREIASMKCLRSLSQLPGDHRSGWSKLLKTPVFQAPRTLRENCDLTPRRSTLGGMAIRRIQIDYTVYSPNYRPGMGLCLDFRNLLKAKSGARGLGAGARVYRNFNQKNKKGQILGDWLELRSILALGWCDIQETPDQFAGHGLIVICMASVWDSEAYLEVTENPVFTGASPPESKPLLFN